MKDNILTRVPLVGPKIAEILKEGGFKSIAELAELDYDHKFSPKITSSSLIIMYAKAIVSHKIIIKKGIKSDFDTINNSNIYFFDAEYDPRGTKRGPYGIFLLGWMNQDGEATQLFLDNQANERELLTKFKDWIKKEKALLVAYSPKSADVPHLKHSFNRLNISTECLENCFFDLYSDLLSTRNQNKQKIFLPILGSFGIKHVSEVLGYQRPNLKILGGLDALYKYRRYQQKRMKRSKEKIKKALLAYHKDDLKMVKFVFDQVNSFLNL